MRRYRETYRVAMIVEGRGDRRALPLLVGRWFEHRQYFNFRIDAHDVIPTGGSGSLKCSHDLERKRGVEYWLNIALGRRPDLVLIVLDADDECQRRDKGSGLGPELRTRAEKVAGDTPVGVVVADREYEAWFLAGPALRRLWQRDKIQPDGLLTDMAKLAGRTGCKELIGRRLRREQGYGVVDQETLSTDLPFTAAMARHAPSFGKLMKELERLTRLARLARRVRGRTQGDR